jgi:single-strand DNA-binding protein
MAKLSLATSTRYKGRDGQWHVETEWHNIVAYRRLAEVLRDYVKKGSQIFVSGALKTSSWQDDKGVKRYSTEIVVQDVQLLDRPRTESSSTDGSDSQDIYVEDESLRDALNDIPF